MTITLVTSEREQRVQKGKKKKTHTHTTRKQKIGKLRKIPQNKHSIHKNRERLNPEFFFANSDELTGKWGEFGGQRQDVFVWGGRWGSEAVVLLRLGYFYIKS